MWTADETHQDTGPAETSAVMVQVTFMGRRLLLLELWAALSCRHCRWGPVPEITFGIDPSVSFAFA
jgi:hypothetical protein